MIAMFNLTMGQYRKLRKQLSINFPGPKPGYAMKFSKGIEIANFSYQKHKGTKIPYCAYFNTSIESYYKLLTELTQ